VRIGLKGSKHVYLGLHTSEVDAAKVYDRALVLLTGAAAATNFPSMQYTAELAEFEECAPRTPRPAPPGSRPGSSSRAFLPAHSECSGLVLILCWSAAQHGGL
jgi:hypothetical protein